MAPSRFLTMPPVNILPQPNRIYSGPNTPVVYDANWQIYTNLTKEQIAWFQSQPEWQQFREYVAQSPTTAMINANVSETAITAALSVGPGKITAL